MKFRSLLLASALLAAIHLAPARAQDSKMNYASHIAKKLDVCPHLRLTNFDFTTAYVEDQGFRRTYSYFWRNEGKKPIAAFEIRVLRFNPFDESLADSVTTFPGNGSGDYSALAPNESSSDGERESSDSDLFTALAFVDKIRFADGTIWRATQATVDAQVKAAMPSLAGAAPKPAPKK